VLVRNIQYLLAGNKRVIVMVLLRRIAALPLLLTASHCFPIIQQQQKSQQFQHSRLYATNNLRVPLSCDEMVRQCAAAMYEAATNRGQTRQIVRVLLPRDPTADDFGKYAESDATTTQDSVLVPPDESWQGGIMMLYRAVLPTAQSIMRRYLQKITTSSITERIMEDRSVDESGVDGVSKLTAGNVLTCWLQPTQETAQDYILQSSPSNVEGIQVILNPQWRQVDDALDTASKGDGMFAALASFLGGKGETLKNLAQDGYVPVYSLEGYVCRGSNVRLLQVLDSDWAVFCERDDGDSFLSIGSCPNRPTYQQVEEMLDNSSIGYKYARDMGFETKL
jgi:hypothetical protein